MNKRMLKFFKIYKKAEQLASASNASSYHSLLKKSGEKALKKLNQYQPKI